MVRTRALFLVAVALRAMLTACIASCARSESRPAEPAAASPKVPDALGRRTDVAPSPVDAAAYADAWGAASVHAAPGPPVDADATASPSSPEGGALLADRTSGCNEQSPQAFLIRGRFLRDPHGNEQAIQYRTDHYGYFKGYGRPGPRAQPPSAFLEQTTFFGLPIKMHRKVVPALRCVEDDIERTCSASPYTPRALAGIRYRNTYRGGEVTNHAYGIAIDIDPAYNTCCGCVAPWNDAPACKRASKSEYDHMAMPECWVHAFERYGFYWLGHDVLKDTMHFEFLGDPDRIAR